jgi:hypothetical protein
MLAELCVGNYATFDGLVNGANDILKTSTTYCEKTIICTPIQHVTNMGAQIYKFIKIFVYFNL